MTIRVPKGACDTHMHFYDGVAAARPGTPNPGRFTVPMYRELQKQLGLDRVIVVQPNAYGDDNSVTVQSISELGSGAKGVAVVKPAVTDAELERLTKAGVCALRIMTLHGGTLGFDVMDELMARVHPFGWHATSSSTAASCRSTRRRSGGFPDGS
jgi:D-galactarolactone isomerase